MINDVWKQLFFLCQNIDGLRPVDSHLFILKVLRTVIERSPICDDLIDNKIRPSTVNVLTWTWLFYIPWSAFPSNEQRNIALNLSKTNTGTEAKLIGAFNLKLRLCRLGGNHKRNQIVNCSEFRQFPGNFIYGMVTCLMPKRLVITSHYRLSVTNFNKTSLKTLHDSPDKHSGIIDYNHQN